MNPGQSRTGARVLVVGDIVTDILAVHGDPLAADSDTVAQISITGGGSAANTAAWLAHAGAAVDLLSAIGPDPAGADRLAELIAAGVDCRFVRHGAARPTGSVIVLARGQDRTMLCDRGANHELDPSDVDSAVVGRPDLRHLHLSGYTLLDASSRPAGLRALARAAERRISTSVDAASAAPLLRLPPGAFLDWVRGCDLLLANLDEAQVLTESTMDAATLALALITHARMVVVKTGADGAVAALAGTPDVIAIPAEPATVVDTTGAGDAFAAGLIAAHLAGADVGSALKAAVRLGAHAVSLVGGRPPTTQGLSPRR